MSGYPWTLLGIDPSDDERAIRRAYAAKLKVTRPDEDPAGFQALLEARDMALQMSRYAFADAPDEQEVPPQLAVVSVAEDASVDASFVPTELHRSSVFMPSVDASVESSSEAEPSEVEALLARVGRPSSGDDLPGQWASVFDALEQANLGDHRHLMWMVLNRLLNDLKQHVGAIPDSPVWQIDISQNTKAKFGPFSLILKDFEGRFGFLRNDTALLDYLNQDDARDLVNALTIVVGRTDPARATTSALVNVDEIHPEALLAAFGRDHEMLDYYDRARREDRYPWSFSLPAVLLGPFFALRHRLHVSAMLSASALVAFVAIAAKNANGADLPYEPLAIGLYVITVVATALRWRRMRLSELSKKVRKLVATTQDLETIQNTLLNWGQPTLGWGWSPFMIFAVLKLVALLASANGPFGK